MGNSPSKNAASPSANTHQALATPLSAAEDPEPDDRKPSSYHSNTTGGGAQLHYNKNKLQKKIPSTYAKQHFQYADNQDDSFDLEINLSMAKALKISDKENHSPTKAIDTLRNPNRSPPVESVKDEISSSFSDVFTVGSSSSSLSLTPPFTNLPPIIEEKNKQQQQKPVVSSTSTSNTIPTVRSSKNKRNFDVDIDSIIEKLLNNTSDSTSSSSPILHSSRHSPRSCSSDEFFISPREISQICQKAREVFLNQPSLLRLSAPVKVVGDLHGQFNDLLRILKLSGLPPNSNYLFLGDYVDRGKQSLETILLLFCFKIKYPENFFMLRGNHESANISKIYGFYDECKRRLNLKSWKIFVDVFNTLPIAAIISDKIFCIHGGLSPNLTNLKQIEQIQRPTDIPEEGLLADLLWSDPDSQVLEWSENDRGVSYCFGKKIVENFTKKFKFDLIIRGHMVVEDGYEFFARKKLVTVFSAPNYCGEFNNWGAVMSVDNKLLCSFELLKPNKKF